MGLNLSEGFGRAGAALQQGVQVHAQEQLEAMRDQRAENLARFSLEKNRQLQLEIAERQEKNIALREAGSETRQQSHEAFMAKQSEQASRDYLDRIAAMGRNQESTTTLREDRQDERARLSRLAEAELRSSQDVIKYDQQLRQIDAEVAKVTAKDPVIPYLKDQQKKLEAIKGNEEIQRLLAERASIAKDKAASVTSWMYYRVQQGDTRFKGFQTPPPAGGDTSTDGAMSAPQPAAKPALIGGNTQPTINSADSPAYQRDIPAYQPDGQSRPIMAPGAMPGGTTMFMPPLKPPQVSLVGPMNASPSLIPMGANGGIPGQPLSPFAQQPALSQ